MMGAAEWYCDDGQLLAKVRQTRTHWGHLPKIAGYELRVEERRG